MQYSNTTKTNRIKSLFFLSCILAISSCVKVTPEPPAPSANEVLVSEIEGIGLTAKETDRGVVIYLPSVIFGFESAKLSEETKGKLKFIAQIFNKNIVQDRSILVEGHTDSIGPDEFNRALSKSRTTAVANQLKQYEVEDGRLKLAWFGESRPLVPNTLRDGSDNPNGRRVNRRVEFIVLNPTQ